jgi:purine-binding chemotaxis protein CheW
MSDTSDIIQQDNDTLSTESASLPYSMVEKDIDPEPSQKKSEALDEKEGKYLTFSLSNEEYGIGILKIKEIIGMMPITSVPRTPKYVRGVINLRGKVIPVIDLRIRFCMEEKDYNDRTCIVVVEIESHGIDMVIGIVVDSVSEVLNIKSEEIEETPEFGTTLNTEYILGMATMEGGVKILLDIDAVLSSEELTLSLHQKDGKKLERPYEH